MTIDCYRCQARGAGCADCAATHVRADTMRADTMRADTVRADTMLGDTVLADTVLGDDCTNLDPADLRALTALANAGLIPPLRYAPRLARAS